MKPCLACDSGDVVYPERSEGTLRSPLQPRGSLQCYALSLKFWYFWQFWQLSLLCSVLLLTSCSRHPSSTQLSPKAYGSQIAEVSGSKQVAVVGSTLPQPVVVQVNDASGNPVTGALVRLHGTGLEFKPTEALSDSSGQVSTAVEAGFAAGDYQVIAETPKQGGGAASLSLREIALGYEGVLGKAVNDKYCIRCHDQESTPERVSNFDNLSPAPHAFADGATYNRFQDSDLINITSHGGPALGKSPQMPAFGTTLKSAEIKAVVAYIRSIADPPYQTSGVKYAK
jgi:mono/diheme cytochrome c family protein